MLKAWKFIAVGVALTLISCGKNDPIVPGGFYAPPMQAPPPIGNGYYGPNYGPGGGQPFNPQLPPGYPNQYTPFLPIDQYMRRTPQMQQVWVNIWVNWQDYSYRRGYDQYDFSRFWYEYCPQQFYGYGNYDIYNYFDNNVYYWADPGMQFSGYNYDPYYFWDYYDGYGYDSFCGTCAVKK